LAQTLSRTRVCPKGRDIVQLISYKTYDVFHWKWPQAKSAPPSLKRMNRLRGLTSSIDRSCRFPNSNSAFCRNGPQDRERPTSLASLPLGTRSDKTH
jgi:hypothetical protein